MDCHKGGAMGFLEFLKKKKSTSQLATTSVKPTDIATRNNPPIQIHDDLKGLLWFADGSLKNYTEEEIKRDSVDIGGGIRIKFSSLSSIEPSLIFMKEPISIPKDILQVERPPYFPTYVGLTPEQREVYINLLLNPYNPSIDIGFVFILYYGLERHLLCGDFERAFKVILKLRDVHKNKSFQSYSANALVLTSMLHQQGNLALEFIKSLDKDYELAFSDNLFLLCYYSFKFPLTAKDIMRMSKTFAFSNQNYIKNFPELFEKELDGVIFKKIKNSCVQIEEYLTSTEVKKLRKQSTPIFANTSIIDKTFPVPMISENVKLIIEMNTFLKTAHEQVKIKIAGMRKEGTPLEPVKKEGNPKKDLVFNTNQEKLILKQLSDSKNDLVKKHFVYLQLEDFYYKYWELNQKYLDACIDYCLRDIDSLKEMEQLYIAQEIELLTESSSLLGTRKMETDKEVREIKTKGFIGRVPSFNRLSIIYENQKDYDKALEVYDKAIDFGHGIDMYSDRKEKLMGKIDRHKT